MQVNNLLVEKRRFLFIAVNVQDRANDPQAANNKLSHEMKRSRERERKKRNSRLKKRKKKKETRGEFLELQAKRERCLEREARARK